MELRIEPRAGGWILVAGPRSLAPVMLALVARLAKQGAVNVLDGGNQFNAYLVSRAVYGRPEVLGRISVSRAFTCYQMLSLLESTPCSGAPFVLLHLLNTFYDESVAGWERTRLLRQCLSRLQFLSQASGGVVSVHPPAVPGEAATAFLGMLQAGAAETWHAQMPAPTPEPPRLF